MLDPKQSLARQKRLLGAMQRTGVDAAVIANPRHVYYFSAHYTNWLHASAFILFSDGRSWLITANLLFLVMQIFYILYLNDTKHT